MTERPEIVIVANPEALADAAAARIVSIVQAAAEAGQRCSIGLAGGGTPRDIYTRLALAEVPWDRVDFYFGDERCVPPDDVDSNYLMASQSLLAGLEGSGARIFRMEAEAEDREAAADAYAALLPPRIDVLLLGMGPDGHTASLFPGHEAMQERARLVVPVKGPKPPPWRLTITAPVIEAAVHTLVMAHGASKAEMISRVIDGPYNPQETPIQLALKGGIWFLDEAAAAQL